MAGQWLRFWDNKWKVTFSCPSLTVAMLFTFQTWTNHKFIIYATRQVKSPICRLVPCFGCLKHFPVYQEIASLNSNDALAPKYSKS